MKLRLAALLVAFFAPHTLLMASDHIDGPVTINHAVADLTDLFAFPSPDFPGQLVVILNVYTGVASNGHFSDKVNYDFLVRQAHVRGDGLKPGFETSRDYRVSCTFETPHGLFAPHWITCTSSKGTAARERVGEVNRQASDSGLRVFAGRRSDPFFFNVKWATAAASEGKLLPPKDDNVMQNLNVLSIVLVIDIEQELGLNDGSLLAVAAETTTPDDKSGVMRRIDRIGRPEITNVSMVAHDDQELRDLYNAEEPFNISGKNVELFRQRLRENVVFYDKLNDTIDWTPQSGNDLAEILLNDFQVVDVSKPFAANTYFEIERSILRGEPHSTCGGRTPNDDIMDVIFTLLVNGGNPPPIRDGVDRPTRLATDVFPYLAEPNDGIAPAFKSFTARAAGKLTIPGRMRWSGVVQLLSGAAALVGAMLLVYYVVRLAIAQLRKREYLAAKRARMLGVCGLFFAFAILCGFITSAFSLPEIGVLTVICSATFVRFARWKKRDAKSDRLAEAPT